MIDSLRKRVQPFATLFGLCFFACPIAAFGQAEKPKPAEDLKRFQPFGYVLQKHDVAISGRALNAENEPVVGAKIFVIPVAPMGVPYGERGVIAEGITDSEGRYQFEKVPLPVLEFAPAAVPRPTEAKFQVFGIAEGYGYVWRRTHAYRPEPRPEKSDADAAKGNKYAFFAEEPIALDLKFSPEIRLHGTITDDTGAPLEDAVVQVGLVNSDRDPPGKPPGMWSGAYQPESRRGEDGSFEGYHVLPEAHRLARTGADGKYEMRGVPRDCRLICFIDYLPEFDSFHTTLVHGGEAKFREHLLPESGELNHVFARPTEVRLTVTGPDRRPIANVYVRRDPKERLRRAGSFSQTRDNGEATLHLMPGAAKLFIEPAIGLPYLPKELEIEVKRGEDPMELQQILERAAEVVFEAVDRSTGGPVSGVALLCEEVGSGLRSPVQSQLSFVDHPRTDDRGRLQAFLRPGTWRFAVDQRRPVRDFEPIAPVSDSVEIQPGKPAVVRFEFSRRPAAEQVARPLISAELKPLDELLQSQREQYEAHPRLRFRVRQNNSLRGTFTPRQMEELLDSLENMTPSEALISLRRAFPELKRLAEFELICDGSRRRVTVRWDDSHPDEVNICNGEELIVSMGAGEQIDLYTLKNSHVHFLDSRDFWDGPVRSAQLRHHQRSPGEEEPQHRVDHRDGTWDIVSSSGKLVIHRTIDDSSGLQRRMSYSIENQSRQDNRQYFPTRLETGVVYPRLSIRVDYQQNDQVRCEVTVIDSVEILDRIPAETFIYAASTGTHILDYRHVPREELGRGRRARSGVIGAPVPDVIAYCNQFAPPAEPVLKVGDPMPEWKVSSWLNAKGPTDRPDFAGRTLVIDFWGIGCGPCVGQLPEVDAAARHFAGSNILIVGLHDSSGTLDKVTEFAKKKDLAFPIAIDTADRNGGGFGMTFGAFGVSGIPTCVVIDSSGKVAYLGRFEEGIEVANKLAVQK